MVKKAPREKGQPGRPSVFSMEIENEICSRLMEGESLRSICRDDHMPGQRTVFERLDDDAHEDFRSRYAHARKRAAEVFEDEIIDVARAATPEDAVARRLQVDALKWVMSKRAPKVYGDKIVQEHTGPGGATLAPPTLIISTYQKTRDDEPDPD